MALPYSSHPIFHLRKAIIVIAIIGAVLCWLGSSHYYYYGDALPACITLLILSGLLCVFDLYHYAHKKVEKQGDDPEWPKAKWIFVDIVMAVLHQLIFWSAIVSLTGFYGETIIAAYGILANFLCSLLHGWCFWKQIMAHYKHKWLEGLSKEPCARCGYLETPALPDQSHYDQRPNTFTYAGPSADFRRADVLTTKSPESAMEEGLLMGSDFGTGYGSIGEPEPTLEQPEEVVIGKGKRKKKVGNSTSDKLAGKKSG